MIRPCFPEHVVNAANSKKEGFTLGLDVHGKVFPSMGLIRSEIVPYSYNLYGRTQVYVHIHTHSGFLQKSPFLTKM